MKFHTSVTLAFAAVQYLALANASSVSCTTDYSNKPTTHVSTETTTKTTNIRSIVTKVSTTTKKAVSTYVSTVINSSSTATIPTPSGFQPLTSATTYTPPSNDDRGRNVNTADEPRLRGARFARAAAPQSTTATATTRYPHDVHCTKTVTHTQPKTTVHSTVTSTAYTKTVTSTVTEPVAVIYAACQADNLLTSYHNQTIGRSASDHSLPSCYSGHEDPCNSAYDCCVDTINNGIYSGWQYVDGYCSGLAGDPRGQSGWLFFPGDNDGSSVYGNGAYAGGQWAGSFTGS